MAETTIDHTALLRRATKIQSAHPRPFLRWAGSKRRLLEDLVPALPTTYRRYWEPFVGGGALFFLLQPPSATLSDACEPLIDTYLAVQADPDAVLRAVSRFAFGEDEYYRVRAMRPRSQPGRAARFIYLNKMGWNGLYRVNSSGDFNVPYGRPKTDGVVDAENLRACASALSSPGVHLASGDFESALKDVAKGDLVFLDPPYVTGHNNNGFIDYNHRLFSWQDQVRLANFALDLRRRGAHVLVTNADHGDVLALYSAFDYIQLERASTLASDKEKRRRVSEALLVGRP